MLEIISSATGRCSRDKGEEPEKQATDLRRLTSEWDEPWLRLKSSSTVRLGKANFLRGSHCAGTEFSIAWKPIKILIGLQNKKLRRLFCCQFSFLLGLLPAENSVPAQWLQVVTVFLVTISRYRDSSNLKNLCRHLCNVVILILRFGSLSFIWWGCLLWLKI